MATSFPLTWRRSNYKSYHLQVVWVILSLENWILLTTVTPIYADSPKCNFYTYLQLILPPFNLKLHGPKFSWKTEACQGKKCYFSQRWHPNLWPYNFYWLAAEWNLSKAPRKPSMLVCKHYINAAVNKYNFIHN